MCVGMFPEISNLFSGEVGLPYVCRDVSEAPHTRDGGLQYSLRMQGCFQLSDVPEKAVHVFPVYAGMFLKARATAIAIVRLPCTCRDVSDSHDFLRGMTVYSLYMQGCFWGVHFRWRPGKVFPVHAGVFRTSTNVMASPMSLPCICRDVSGSSSWASFASRSALHV